MADETKVTIKAKVAQKIINNGDISYSPLKGELVAIKKGDNFSLAIGQENEDSTELKELNYVEGKADNFYITAGQGTGTPGTRATAEGNSVTASGENSHAEGSGTTASGKNSHAEGSSAIASGENSHAEGYGTIASAPNSHVFGRYNLQDSEGDYVEIVGKGNENTRSNARTLDWNGNEVLAGKLTVGSGATNDNDVPHLGQIKAMVVSSSSNGLVPAISSVSTEQAILGAKKVNNVMVPQWLTFEGGTISIPNVSEEDAGIVPAYGTNAGNKFLIIDETTKQPVWVNAINKNLLPPSTVNNGKYLMTQNGQYVWTVIVDDSSYNSLVDIINSPIEFLKKIQSS